MRAAREPCFIEADRGRTALRAVPSGVKDVPDIAAQMRFQQHGALVQASPELRFIAVETFSHAGMLTALAAEEEADRARDRLLRRYCDPTRIRQRFCRFRPAAANHESTIWESLASHV